MTASPYAQVTAMVAELTPRQTVTADIGDVRLIITRCSSDIDSVWHSGPGGRYRFGCRSDRTVALALEAVADHHPPARIRPTGCPDCGSSDRYVRQTDDDRCRHVWHHS